MRRYKKKELLETADMLVEANDIIGRLCISNPDRALEILGQCQESAILLGNLIESRGEQYAGLVEILESYCENLYQMSMALSDEEQIRKLSKKIQKQLIHLNNRISHEIPEDKKEVVFFPYKASMWDSLESVWQAADEDEGTDAYVVPIPYYDKNPDGTFREMHYEGNEYPDYVPITNWEKYDFEERKPDVIYIHNPYDNFNYVTSVHPRFYSGNLKKYTEKLVYIPYFILGEVKPDDDKAIEGMKHFCINEAVKNADKVIVQSEDMRQVYINVLTEESGGSKEARAYWKKKIDGSGSPKVDKVLRTKREELDIPEDWMKVIRKPDGSFKKIILYNTSVTALLKNDEKMLKKIESVFQTFYENRAEVTLLWRPHPLMESTLISMRPDLWEEYRRIRKKYREEDWGIYDDTADMDRAVILSDAYYGDGSSIVQLYQKTGKPVMIQNVDIIDHNTSVLLFNSMHIEENQGFFVSTYYWKEKVFKIDLVSGEICDLADIPVSPEKPHSFSLIAGDEDVITVMPYLGIDPAVQYNLREKLILPVEKMSCEENKIVHFPKCTNSITFKNSVFFILNDENWLLEYQCGDSRYVIHELQMQKEIKQEEWSFYWMAYAQIDDKVYFPLKNSGKIAELSLIDFSVKIVKEFADCNIQRLTYLDGYMWLMPMKKAELLRWDMATDKDDLINVSNEECREYTFCGIYEINGLLVLIANHALGIYAIHKTNLTIEKISGEKLGISENIIDEELGVTIVCEQEHYLFYIVNKIPELLIRIDKRNGDIRKYDLKIDVSKTDEIDISDHGNLIYNENYGTSLIQYVKNVKRCCI